MFSRLAYTFAVLLLLVGTTIAFASIQSSHGPIASSTGAPAVGGKPDEWNCTLCHYAGGDNLDRPGGGLEILGAPGRYAPGQFYPLTVRMSSDSTTYSATRKWGFQITAVRASDGTGVGTFILPHPDTLQILMGESGDFATRRYVEHTSLGTRTGLGGSVQWTFTWQAPALSVGPVYFFCSANAADGTGDSGGDYVYTARDTSLAPANVEVVAIASLVAFAPPAPNPARGPVTLSYTLAARSLIELSIFDLQGRKVRGLASGWREAGHGNAQWDGQREDGTPVPNGTFFARLALPGAGPALTRKITIDR